MRGNRFHTYIIMVVTSAVLALVGCGDAKEREAERKGNGQGSQRPAVFVQTLGMATNEPASALRMADSLRACGALPAHEADLLRAKIYSQSLEGLWLDSAIIIGERLMALDVASEDMGYRHDVLETLVNACRLHCDEEQAIGWCTLLIDLCRQEGRATETLRNTAEMGQMLSELGKADEGLARIDSVIHQLRGQRRFNEMDACIIALRRKATVLDREGRYADVPAVAQEVLALLADYEAHPQDYHDGSYREVAEEERPDYIGFYRAKAHAYLAQAYAHTGDRQQARHYLDLYGRSSYAHTYDGRKLIAPVQCLMGDYDQMEAIYGEEEARLRAQGDTVKAAYAAMLRDRAVAAEAQGRTADALRLRKRCEAIEATLHNRLVQGKAHLYAARFHEQEQQSEIERQKAENRHAAMTAFLVGILALLALLIAALLFRQRRALTQKNRALTQQIKDTLAYARELMAYKERYEGQGAIAEEQRARSEGHEAVSEGQGARSEEQEDSLSSRPLTPHPSPLNTQHPTISDMSPAELFEHIRQVIDRERLYLDPQFDRQAATKRFGVTKEQIGAAFAQGSSYGSITNFIRESRLYFAFHLLEDEPDKSIGDIARASGYTNPSTFASDFRKQFGLTPSEQRKGGA